MSESTFIDELIEYLISMDYTHYRDLPLFFQHALTSMYAFQHLEDIEHILADEVTEIFNEAQSVYEDDSEKILDDRRRVRDMENTL